MHYLEDFNEKIENIQECIIIDGANPHRRKIVCKGKFDIEKLDIDYEINMSSNTSFHSTRTRFFGIIIFKDGWKMEKDHDEAEWRLFNPSTIKYYIETYKPN